jgi:hypothetical protein
MVMSFWYRLGQFVSGVAASSPKPVEEPLSQRETLAYL